LVQVGKEQRQLDDIVQCAARFFDDGLHIGKRLAYLGLEVFGHQVAGAWLEPDLAGQIHRLGAGNGNRLRVRADGGRRFVGMDDLLAHGPYPWVSRLDTLHYWSLLINRQLRKTEVPAHCARNRRMHLPKAAWPAET